ncbi:MAG: hypothetical protein ACUVSV_05550 [Armatimonadota bacterium]
MKRLLVLLGVLALTTTVVAQPGPGGPGARQPRGMGFGMGFGMGGGLGLLMMPKVQKELNLSEQQLQQIQQLMAQQREQMQPLMQEMRNATPEQLQKLMEQVMQKWDEALGKVLQPTQKTRLRELQIQAQGASALAHPDVAKELNLSEEQRKKISDILAQYGQKQMQLWQEGRGPNVDRQALMQQIQQLRQQMDKELLAVLTSQQQEQWKKIQGKPFEFPRRPGMFPGGPPGGAGARREL